MISSKFPRKQGAVVIITIATVAALVGTLLLFTAFQGKDGKDVDVVTTAPKEGVKHEEEKSMSEGISVEERVEVEIKEGREGEDAVKTRKEKGREVIEQPSKQKEPSKPVPKAEGIVCLPMQGEKVPEGLTLNLSLSKSYGLPNSTVHAIASLRSMDESVAFTITHVRFAWFSTSDGDGYDGSDIPKQLTDWEESRILWDYTDDGYIIGDASIYVKVPDMPANTDIVMAACLVEKSTKAYRELGFITKEFRVTAEEKVISYYRIDSIDDLYTKFNEALSDRGIVIEEDRVRVLLEQVVSEGESDAESNDVGKGMIIREGSYLFIDATEGSLYAIACITSSKVVKDGDDLQCFFIGLDSKNYSLVIDVVYSDGRTYTVYEDEVESREFAYRFTHIVDGSDSDGRVYVVARVDDHTVLEIGMDIITKLDISGLCAPWVKRDVSIFLEPAYGLPGSDVNARIGIKILPEDESMRWMFEYVTVTWLDDANRPIPTSWRFVSDDGESMVSRWKEPLKIISWGDGDGDIYTGSTRIMLNVPEVEEGSWLKLLVCFVHPMPGGYMDMVNSYTTFYVGSESPKEEQKKQEEQQQQQQQQQPGALPCSIYPGGDRQITFSIEPRSGTSGSSVTAKFTVRVNPGDYGEPFDPTKHWRWMYEDVKFFWLDTSNNVIASSGPIKVIQWSSSDPLYGEGTYNLTVPRSGSSDVRILACFMHPMPGGYMEMTYRVERFTITDATPGADTQQSQQPTQDQYEQGRVESINFDIGEICGRYTGDREFISLNLKRSDESTLTASVRVVLNSNDPNLQIWKFMYSYTKFRWYNYSTGTYASDWTPSLPQQLIREWNAEDGKVVGRAEYTVALPDVSPASRLGLIACFSHPWSGPTGYMDMNYTVAGYLMPSTYYTMSNIDDLNTIVRSALYPLSTDKVDSITATLDQIKHRLDRDSRYIIIDVREGSIYLLACLLKDIPAEIGDSMQCIAIADAPTSKVSITVIRPDGTFTKRNYSMERVGDNMVFIASITLGGAGDWMVLAEFGDGGMTSMIRASVAFNVIPEGMLGAVTIIASTLVTAILYLVIKGRRITTG